MSTVTRKENFLFNSIRKYNKANRQTQRDIILHSVGVQAGLIEKRRLLLPELSPAERKLILNHLRDFCKTQGIEVLLKQ